MKHIIIAALFAASIIAGEPDWGKVIEQSKNPHHHDDCDYGHHSSVPEPGTWVLIGAGMLGLAAWQRRK